MNGFAKKTSYSDRSICCLYHKNHEYTKFWEGCQTGFTPDLYQKRGLIINSDGLLVILATPLNDACQVIKKTGADVKPGPR